MGRAVRARVGRPTVGTIALPVPNRGYIAQLHVSIEGSGRTLCGRPAPGELGVVTVHDRITCNACVNIVVLVRQGYLEVTSP